MGMVTKFPEPYLRPTIARTCVFVCYILFFPIENAGYLHFFVRPAFSYVKSIRQWRFIFESKAKLVPKDIILILRYHYRESSREYLLKNGQDDNDVAKMSH